MKIAPDTSSFKFFNANPKNRRTGDCVIRAISTALGQSWVVTLVDLTKLSVQTGYCPLEPRVYGKYLEMKGWVKCKQPRSSDGRKVKACDFFLIGDSIPCVLNVGGHHVTCIVNGRVHDIWDCTDSCVGNFWIPAGYAERLFG